MLKTEVMITMIAWGNRVNFGLGQVKITSVCLGGPYVSLSQSVSLVNDNFQTEDSKLKTAR